MLLDRSTIKKKSNFKLAAILEVDPEKQPNSIVLNRLFAAGLDLLYLRTNSIKNIAWKHILDSINPEFWELIIVPVEAKKSLLNLKMIEHWKEAERERLQPEKMLPTNLYSTSVHHLSDVLKLPPAFRYVFYSPLFESISKPGYKPQHDLKTVRLFLENIRKTKAELPFIIGLGGIKVDNIHLVKELGLNGATLMGALWQASDPVLAFKEIKIALDC